MSKYTRIDVDTHNVIIPHGYIYVDENGGEHPVVKRTNRNYSHAELAYNRVQVDNPDWDGTERQPGEEAWDFRSRRWAFVKAVPTSFRLVRKFGRPDLVRDISPHATIAELVAVKPF